MAVKGRSEEAKTSIARLAFANGLFKIRESDSGRKEWQCSLLYPKGSDMKIVHKMCEQAAEAAWPGKAADFIKAGIVKNPILDGDGPQGANKKTGERLAGFAGNHFIRVKSGEQHRPKLVNRQVLPITSEEEMYSGCYVYPVIHAYAWEDDKGGKGISFGVSMIQKVNDGDRLGGGNALGNPEDVFEKIPDEGEAPSETKSGAGAAGLFG